MILRLVYSFFFFSLVTGNKQLDGPRKISKRGSCENKICYCEDNPHLKSGHHSSPSITYRHKIIHGVNALSPKFKVDKASYGYAAKPGSGPDSQIETNRYDAGIMSDNDSPSFEVPVRHSREDSSEKTICFTPKMIHKMVRAALEYVSGIPADITKIVEKLEQELNKIPDSDSYEDHYIRKKPLYPLDSRTIFHVLNNKPNSESRNNLILKYELPGDPEPQCKDALEKLIEIAHSAYSELQQYPQCRDYLYKFASHQQDDRPKGHIDNGPDMKSLVGSLLDEVDKQKLKPSAEYNHPDYDNTDEIDILVPEIPIPQIQEIQEIRVPQEHIHIQETKTPRLQEHKVPYITEYSSPEMHDYNRGQPSNEYNVPQIHEINIEHNPEMKMPQVHEYSIPQKIHEYTVPQQSHEFTIPQQIHEYTIPQQSHEFTIPPHEYTIPQQSHEFTIPQQSHEFTIPPHEYTIPQQSHEFTIPPHEYTIPQQSHEFTIPPHEYTIPQQSHEFTIPQQSHEFTIPQQIHEYTIPQQSHEYTIPQQSHEYPIPQQSHEYPIPQQSHEYTIPQQSHEYPIPQHSHDHNIPHQNHEYNIPQEIHEINIPQQVHEINIPQQVHEINIPQVYKNHDLNTPQIHEYSVNKIPGIQQIHEIPNIQPVQEVQWEPEETYNILTDILKNNDNNDNRDLLDRFVNIIEDNKKKFHPKVYHALNTLVNKQKQQPIPKLDDIISFIIDSQRKKQWPWNDKITDPILSSLTPDQNDDMESKVVDIILDLHNKPTDDKLVEYIMSLLRPIKEGKLDPETSDLIIKLVRSNINNLLTPEYTETLIKLLKPSRSGLNHKKVDIVDNLAKWNELGIRPDQLDALITLLKPDVHGNTDPRVIDIIHFLLTQNKYLTPKHLDFIISFLDPDENDVVDPRRLDIIHFLLNSTLHPQLILKLLQLLEDNSPAILNSKYLDLLIILKNNRLLTPELEESIIELLFNDISGHQDDDQVKSLYLQLAPFKQTNPNVVDDIITLLNQGGINGNIVEWLESPSNSKKVAVPSRDSTPKSLHIIPNKFENLEEIDPNNDNVYRSPEDGYDSDDDFMSILKWLDTQGLLNADQGSNNDLVNNILKILNMRERDLGVVELTYMLKHEKPLIYQPVYYVKYRLPILSFITNLKNILLENPQLTADPMKLLQEMIVVSNVTEVSPNLQGFPKEEILKLTVNDGDLVQAKILDEQNLNLNEQISHVHDLNSDISPEELLQLNRMNEAKYYPDVLEFRGTYPEKVTMHENKVMKFPTVHYKQVQVEPVLKHQTHTFHYIERTKRERNTPQYQNAQLRSSG